MNPFVKPVHTFQYIVYGLDFNGLEEKKMALRITSVLFFGLMAGECNFKSLDHEIPESGSETLPELIIPLCKLRSIGTSFEVYVGTSFEV